MSQYVLDGFWIRHSARHWEVVPVDAKGNVTGPVITTFPNQAAAIRAIGNGTDAAIEAWKQENV